MTTNTPDTRQNTPMEQTLAAAKPASHPILLIIGFFILWLLCGTCITLQHLAAAETGFEFIRSIVLIGLMLLCFAICFMRLRPQFLRRQNRLVYGLVASCLHIGLITAGVLMSNEYIGNDPVLLASCLPLCLIPALSVMLLGVRVSTILALFLSALTPLLLEQTNQLTVFPYSVIFMLLSVAFYRRVTRVSQLIRCGIGLFLMLLFLGAFFAWLNEWNSVFSGLIQYARDIRNAYADSWQNHTDFFKNITAIERPNFWPQLVVVTFCNSLFITLFTAFSMPVFECFLDVISPIRLEHLARMDHPLLERLKQEARGTYEHSISVGLMAGEAAEAIGANAMLARVAGFFHDIGKLYDPTIFAENAYMVEKDPHEGLTPYESCRRIREHIKYGRELAQKNHLPEPIISAIVSHHGNDVISYFYNVAVKQAEAKGEIPPNPRVFRYDAPLPRSRENVILEIADVCEAAARARLSDPNKLIDYAVVEAFIIERINAKFSAGQFGRASLTLQELSIITRSFTEYLCGKYHHRPKYNTPEPTPEPDVAEPVPAETIADVKQESDDATQASEGKDITNDATLTAQAPPEQTISEPTEQPAGI